MATLFWVGSGANWNTTNWSTSSGGTTGSGPPASGDDVKFDSSSPGNCTLTASTSIGTLDCSGFTHTLTHNANQTLTISGATFKLASGMTYTLSSPATSALSFTSTGTVNITCAGKNVGNLTFNGAGATFTPQDSLTQSGTSATCTLTAGTLDNTSSNANHTWAAFSCTGSASRTLKLGTGTVTILGSGGSMWAVSGTNVTVTATNATISLTSATSTNGTFATGGNTNASYGSLTITGGGSGKVTFSAGTTFNGTVTINAPKTVQWQHGQTFTFTKLVANGSTGNVITLASDLAASQVTWAQPSTVGGFSLNWCSFQDINNAGPATIWAGTNSTNVSNNSGITFTAPALTVNVSQSQTTAPRAASTTSASVSQAQAAALIVSAQPKPAVSQAQAITAAGAAVRPKTITPTAVASTIAITRPVTRPPFVSISQAQATTRGATQPHITISPINTPALAPAPNLFPSPGLFPQSGQSELTFVAVDESVIRSSPVQMTQSTSVFPGRRPSHAFSLSQAASVTKKTQPRKSANVSQSTSATATRHGAFFRTVTPTQNTTVVPTRMVARFRIIRTPQSTPILFSTVAEHVGIVDARQQQNTTASIHAGNVGSTISVPQAQTVRLTRFWPMSLTVSQNTTVGVATFTAEPYPTTAGFVSPSQLAGVCSPSQDPAFA